MSRRDHAVICDSARSVRGIFSRMQASASVTASGDSKAAIGEALKQALSGNRLQSISLHDERGDVLWLDEGALGPDEHNLVLEAASALTEGTDKTIHFQVIGDGRSAAFLPARSPLNELLGLAMIIADAKFLDAKGAAKFVTPDHHQSDAAAGVPAPSAAARRRLPPRRRRRPGRAAAGAEARQRPSRRCPPRPPRPPRRASRHVRRTRSSAAAASRCSGRSGWRPRRPASAGPAARGSGCHAPPRRRPRPPPPAARPGAPAAVAGAPARPDMQQRASGSADSDSIAFEISDIDPEGPAEGRRASRGAAAGSQASRSARGADRSAAQARDLNAKAARHPAADFRRLAPGRAAADRQPAKKSTSEEATTEVEATRRSRKQHERRAGVRRRRRRRLAAGPGQFDYYGQVFELHVQQLVKLKGSGGTRRYEVLVRDAHADNEFGTAPERVVQDVHDPERQFRSRSHRGRTTGALDGRASRRVGNRARELLGERRHGHDRRSRSSRLRRRRAQESEGARQGAGLRDHREILRRAGARSGRVHPVLREARLPRGARRLHLPSQLDALAWFARRSSSSSSTPRSPPWR